MSIATMPATIPQQLQAPKGHAASNILTSEWTKIRTVRSTYRTLLAAAVATIGLSAIVCAVFVAQLDGISASDLRSIDPSSLSLTGGVLAQLAIAVLGVLAITSEYGSGMIRTTFAATPRRVSVLAAKSAVFGAVTLVVTTVACFVAFFVGQMILSSKDFGVSISAPNALRTIIGTALYLTILGLLALGLGTLIRRTAGAISAVVGLIFVLPVVSSFLPASMQSIEKFLPSSAGQAILAGSPAQASTAPMLAPWTGLAVFGLYAAIALIAAAITLKRRDA